MKIFRKQEMPESRLGEISSFEYNQSDSGNIIAVISEYTDKLKLYEKLISESEHKKWNCYRFAHIFSAQVIFCLLAFSIYLVVWKGIDVNIILISSLVTNIIYTMLHLIKYLFPIDDWKSDVDFRNLSQSYVTLQRIMRDASDIHEFRGMNAADKIMLDAKIAEAEMVIRKIGSIDELEKSY